MAHDREVPPHNDEHDQAPTPPHGDPLDPEAAAGVTPDREPHEQSEDESATPPHGDPLSS